MYMYTTCQVIDRPKKKKKKKKQKGDENQLTKEESELALLMEVRNEKQWNINSVLFNCRNCVLFLAAFFCTC